MVCEGARERDRNIESSFQQKHQIIEKIEIELLPLVKEKKYTQRIGAATTQNGKR